VETYGFLVDFFLTSSSESLSELTIFFFAMIGFFLDFGGYMLIGG
jgi:hypothetical protein